MSEQTTSDQKSLTSEATARKQSLSAFGGRSDGCVGTALGLAPNGLASAEHADPNAPPSLGAARIGSNGVSRKVQPVAPTVHPFAAKMRAAAEKYARERAEREEAATDKAAANQEADIEDADFVEASASPDA